MTHDQCKSCRKKKRQQAAKRSEYFKNYYQKNRDKKLAAAKARYVPVDQQDVAFWEARNWEL